MTLRTLARSSLRYYLRSHLGVLAGATLAAAVLIGALAVGDSVQESLKRQAWERIGAFTGAIRGGDRFFRQEFLEGPGNQSFRTTPVLELTATIARQDGSARANSIRVFGVRPTFRRLLKLPFDGETKAERERETGSQSDPEWSATAGSVSFNRALAERLHAVPGDQVVIRIHKPSALSRDAVITPRDDQSVALRLKVDSILRDQAGNVDFSANQTAPLNAFVNFDELARAAGVDHRANLLLYAENGRLARMPTIDRMSLWLLKEADLLFRRLPQLPPNIAIPIGRFLASHRDINIGIPVLLSPAAPQIRDANEILAENWTLDDAELSVRSIQPAPKLTGGEPAPAFTELSTRRIFLEPPVVRAALTNAPGSIASEPTPILTYLVNALSHGDQLAPYSMVTAAGAPYTPADLRDDEIVINDWLAADLKVQPGDPIAVTYYRVDAGTQLVERTNTFRVHSIVPMRGLHADRSLMPEFPGLTKAESTRDWDAGFDMVHPIRDKDEAYWKQWRGTPKAFITLAAGKSMWANRFGDLTAIRWMAGTNDPARLRDSITGKIRSNLNPAEVGLQFTDVRTPALAAAESGTGKEFGGLMIGFSFFLIVSALLLTAMLFSFSLEQRAVETGTLLALGWQPKQVRRLLIREGVMLAAFGTVFGAIGGIYYAKGVLWGLSTLWRDAVAGAGLEFHLTTTTLITGILGSLLVATITLAMTLRRQTNRPARELLNEGANETIWVDPAKRSRWPRRIAIVLGIAAIGMAGGALATHNNDPESFFSAGALLLIAGILGVREWLQTAVGTTSVAPTLTSLALRGMTRRTRRSLATVSLLASAAFLIIAVAANRLDAQRDATQRGSGTGGFAFWAESSLPVIQDLNTRKGQEFYGLDPKSMKGVSVVPLRVRDGDDASCLNLNRAQRPRLLGVKPELLAQRGAFTFTGFANGVTVTNGWLALNAAYRTNSGGVDIIPGIADANSIQWALGKQLGDTLDYLDERGRPFKVRLVGAVANSILQGSVIVSEDDFVRRFANEGGYRAFLVDAPVDGVEALAAQLTRALQDNGLEVISTARRLDAFNAVQNTYLNTFQILGGLGLLLGSVGLGVVVSRNVFERRGELAVLQAIGFGRPQLRRFVLTEHAAVLFLGLAVGTGAAVLAVLPAIVIPGSQLPWGSLALTLLAVLANGLLWTWLATRRALRKPLLDSLRAL